MANRTSRALAALVLALVCVWAVSTAGARQAADPAAAQEGVELAALTLTVIPYQGRLSDPSTGDAVADGNYSMTFRLYDVTTGGSALWTETKDVAVQGGVFSTALGDSASLSHNLFNGQALWLGVEVNGDGEASPRQQLLPVAYALSLVPGAVVKSSGSTTGLRVTTTGSGDALQVSGPTSLDGDLSVTGSLSGGSHTHSGADIASGTVAEARIAAAIARDSEILPIVAANDGSGSGLDADLLDGKQATEFAGATHSHSGGDITSGTVAEARIAAAIARDSEIMPIVKANDGAGSTLDADLLDGKQATEFAPSSHTHKGTEIVDGSIGTVDLADGAVTSAKLASTAIPRFISIDPYGALLDGGTFSTGFGPNAGMHLPNSGTPDFAYGFTIPPGYSPGTTLYVRLVWNTASSGCSFVLAPNFISIARSGRTHIMGSSASSGLYGVGGDILSSPGVNVSALKYYSISSPESGTQLQAGDSIIFGLYRSAGSASDTCAGDLIIQGVRIDY